MRSMHRELDAEFAAVSELDPGSWPYSSAVMIQTCVKHFITRRVPGSSWISRIRHLPSGRSAWARVEPRLIVERQAAVLDLSVATTTTLVGVRPLAGGNSHLQGVTPDRPIIGLLQKICASTSMKAVMRGP
jgi:hypothetical protein